MPKPITLSAGYSDGVTVIPNTFFDEYLKGKEQVLGGMGTDGVKNVKVR